MNFTERRKYLAVMYRRYQKASPRERSALLDEMEAVTNLHRKSLIRLMQGPVALERKPRRNERGPVYGPEVRAAVSLIAQALDYPSAERLQPVLASMASLLAPHGLLRADDALPAQLAKIGVSTVRQILDGASRDKPRPVARTRHPSSALLRDIPAGRIPWDIGEPGHLEVDLVHHSGPSASGEYILTLQMVDISTGWVELWAILGRSYLVMEDAFRQVLRRIPFPIRQLHPDNDSAFFNAHLLRFWTALLPDGVISRSRPYHKNDNRFVEERNHFLVRSWIGDDRLDTVAQAILLNRIYEGLWMYANLFLPVMRIQEKVHIPTGEGKFRTRRVYDRARPPLERLEESGVVSPQRLEALKRLRDQINPLQLREAIYDQVEQLFSLPGATPGVTENVFETLNLPSGLPEEVLAPVTLSFGLTRENDPGAEPHRQGGKIFIKDEHFHTASTGFGHSKPAIFFHASCSIWLPNRTNRRGEPSADLISHVSGSGGYFCAEQMPLRLPTFPSLALNNLCSSIVRKSPSDHSRDKASSGQHGCR